AIRHQGAKEKVGAVCTSTFIYMALSGSVRRGLSSLKGLAAGKLPGQIVAPANLARTQVASIVSKTLRDANYKRPAPFDYKSSKYGFIHALMDKTTYRFDENSKIIVVDGPIASGKTAFAKEIAEDLDMLYVPEANMDMIYINDYGFDMRKLDPQLPEDARSCDISSFLKDPNQRNAAAMQFEMYRLRLQQYIDALAHVLSTGQGVVMDRSVYSDFVFVDTMAKFGFMSKGAQNLYYECKKATASQLMRPHLCIYLDVPVDDVLKRLEARGDAPSPFLTREVLSHMETVYKQQYLKEIGNHAELLIYNWSESGDAEVVVEDIERIDFERFDKNDSKLSDWRQPDEWEWCTKRMEYTKFADQILHWMNVPDFSVPELVMAADDHKKFNDVWWSAPGMKYAKGFNEEHGDAFVLTKV
ncbi:unnamed protein product, partial [Meganyctiphanes norvegica]